MLNFEMFIINVCTYVCVCLCCSLRDNFFSNKYIFYTYILLLTIQLFLNFKKISKILNIEKYELDLYSIYFSFQGIFLNYVMVLGWVGIFEIAILALLAKVIEYFLTSIVFLAEQVILTFLETNFSRTCA